jgi:transposase
MLCSLHTNLGEKMTKLKRATYSAAIKLETAQLVVDQSYTQEEAAKAMGVGKSTVSKWVTQLKQERNGQAPSASPMTPEQIEIRELKKQIQRIELEKDILKKATALLMSDSLNNSR